MVATNRSHLFQKGKSGNPLGKPKGTKNKIRYEVSQILEEYKCNPFVILAQIATNKLPGYKKDIGVLTRKEAASELAQYVAPKLKAIEHSSGEGVENFTVVLNYAPPKDDNVS